MIFSLVAMTGLEKCCITSAYLQRLCHSGERPVARGPLVVFEGAGDGEGGVGGGQGGVKDNILCDLWDNFLELSFRLYFFSEGGGVGRGGEE